MRAKWDLKITAKEIVKHLEDHHKVDINSRYAQTYEEFIQDHFVNDGLLFPVRSDEYKSALRKVKEAIKLGEKQGIGVIVYPNTERHPTLDYEIPVWRICEADKEKVGHLRYHRYEPMAFGLFRKIERLIKLYDDKLSFEEVAECYIEWKKKRGN